VQLQRIAVGTDFSEDSERAVAQALAIAEVCGAQVHIVHMVGPLEPPPRPLGPHDRYTERIEQELERAKCELDKLGARYAGAAARIHHYAGDGEPDFGLVETAVEIGAELIIIGSHGRTGYKRVLMGSVSERVVKLAKIDVMVARKRPSGSFKKILVPVDFSAASERALRAAVELVEAPGRVEVVHFWRPPGHEWRPRVESEASARVRDDAETRGRELLARYQKDGVELSYAQDRSAAVPGIMTALERARDHDLVMLGSHGARRRERWLLGNVAERIVRHAPCSVWIVRPPAKPA
jgi:nucleotide-binding universal stress UspA family protein